MTKSKDMMGLRFGKLLVVGKASNYVTPSTGRKTAKWVCVCECGNRAEILGYALRNGDTKSCGCLKRVCSITHNLVYHPLYSIWVGMIARCHHPKSQAYKDYGGRGIKVCDEWHDVSAFIAYMPPRPSELHSIDRINNDGNYEPGNVRWATKQEQHNNRRDNNVITAFGKTMNVTDWGEISKFRFSRYSYPPTPPAMHVSRSRRALL